MPRWDGEFEPEESLQWNLHILSFNMEIFKVKKFTAYGLEREVHKKVTGPNSRKRKIKSTLVSGIGTQFWPRRGGGGRNLNEPVLKNLSG